MESLRGSYDDAVLSPGLFPRSSKLSSRASSLSMIGTPSRMGKGEAVGQAQQFAGLAVVAQIALA